MMEASAFFFFFKLSVSFCSVGISLTGGGCPLALFKSLAEAAGQLKRTISKYIFARVYVLYMPVCSHLSLHVKIQESVHSVCRFL